MNPVDGALAVLAALALVFGWRLGLVSTVTSLLAVAVGGMLGGLLGLRVVGVIEPAREMRVLLLMGTVVAGIVFAQAVAAGPLKGMHEAVIATRWRYLNGAGGAALTAGFALAVVWMLATALTLVSATSVQLASLMRGSAMLVQLDRTVPVDAGIVFRQLETTVGVGETGVFSGLGLLPVPPLAAPTGPASATAEQTALESVVRIMGNAECGTGIAGSGVVVADGLVLTNAHVVAGVDRPYVFGADESIGSPSIPVYYDPALDAALLRVPGLQRPVASLGQAPQPSSVVAAAGFPNAGSQSVKPVGVRGMVRATSSDIYGSGRAQREVLVVSGQVMPGDSGGPLLDGDGRVVGLIFAAATTLSGATGYAITVDHVRELLAEAATDGAADTGTCTPAN